MEKKKRKNPEEIIPIPPLFPPYGGQQVVPWFPSVTDPQGSWTGKPEETEEIPVQDADDL